jgi:hypothetical protein
MFVDPFVFLSIILLLSVCPSVVYLPILHYICLFVCIFLYLSPNVSLSLLAYPSVILYISPSLCLSIH